MTRSCSVSPMPAMFCRYTRSPITIGAERPPYGARQARFSPVGDHLTGRFFSVEMPSRAGPRHSAQSLKAKMEKARQRFREMEIRLVILEARHWLWMNAYLTTQKNCFGIKKSLRACNPEDVEYVSSRCCVTKFLRDSIRFHLVLQFTRKPAYRIT